jgi:hypothetical protein
MVLIWFRYMVKVKGYMKLKIIIIYYNTIGILPMPPGKKRPW